MKVLGMGFPKTGTNSLKEALGVFGLKVEHYPGEYHRRMMLHGDFSWPEDYEGLVNTGENYYRTLHRIYGDEMRFILTTRETESWAESLRKWWLRGGDKTSKWCHLDELRRLDRVRVFGTGIFNYDHMVSIYEQHNDSARAYFADKPNFIELPVELTDDEKWLRLSGLFGMETPLMPYPVKNRARL